MAEGMWCADQVNLGAFSSEALSFELVDQFPEPDFESMVVGPKPCRVHFKRRAHPL